MSGFGVRTSPILSQLPVSGLYTRREAGGVRLDRLVSMIVETVRLDVDSTFPQMIASGSYARPFSVFSPGLIDWLAYDLREISDGTWEGPIVRRWGDEYLVPHDTVRIHVPRSTVAVLAPKMTITFTGSAPDVSRVLEFESPYFRTAQVEYDTVDDASRVTYVDTWAHPSRPASLPHEQLTITKAYDRAGIDLQQEPNALPVVPVGWAGEDEKWSDQELHDAMRTYWSRYKPRAQWALWLLFASRHEDPSYKGIMFDSSDRNPNDRYQRQGAAVFAGTIAEKIPPGETHQAEWVRRDRFFAAVHEIGHCFNLLHSWEKYKGDPWIIGIPTDPNAESFMNYPQDVDNFWDSFQYRFDDAELIFMRHAPEEFVEMGGSLAGKDHGYSSGTSGAGTRSVAIDPRFALELNVSRARPVYQFLEPVTVGVKLTNVSNHPLLVDSALLDDLRTPTLSIRPWAGLAQEWRPYVRHCSLDSITKILQPQESLEVELFASAGVGGWYLAEPGSYTLQASLHRPGGDIIAAPLSLRIASPQSWEEDYLAQSFFTDEVGRALALGGTRTMTSAIEALEEAADRLKGRAVARHAKLTLALPLLRARKELRLPEGQAPMSSVGADGGSITLAEAKPDEAKRLLQGALLDDAPAAVGTFGRAAFERQVEMYANWLEQSGDRTAAASVRSQLSKASNAQSDTAVRPGPKRRRTARD